MQTKKLDDARRHYETMIPFRRIRKKLDTQK